MPYIGRGCRQKTLHGLLRVGEAIAVLVFVAAATNVANATESFRYRGITRSSINDVWTIEPPDEGEASGNLHWADVSLAGIKYCKSDSAYICIWTPYFAFAVPRDLAVTQQREWEIEGYRFERISERTTIAFLGIVVDDVYFLKTPAQAFSNGRELGSSGICVYSPTLGLIAFEDIRTHQYLWSTARYGFGSAPQE